MLSTKFPSTSDVKQFQAYLILAAGFEVTEMPEMPRSRIFSEMHSAYLRQAGNKRKSDECPPLLRDLPSYIEVIKRSKKFEDISDDNVDLHDGSSLWRRFGELKARITNVITPIFNKQVPGGTIPSGKNAADILALVLKDVFENDQNDAAKKSKNLKFKKKVYQIEYRPVEWTAFIAFGRRATLNGGLCHDLLDLRSTKVGAKSYPFLFTIV